LKRAEEKLRRELARYKDELSYTSASMMKIKTDHSPLKKQVKDFEACLATAQTSLAAEQALRVALNTEKAQLEIELEVYKNKSEENHRLLKDQMEQVNI